MPRSHTMSTAAAAVFAAMAATALYAQKVTFALSMSHQSYVAGEPVELTFRIGNAGATPIIVSDFEAYSGNRVEIEITSQDQTRLRPFRDGSIIDDLSLEKDEVQAYRVPLSDWFALPVGRYRVSVKLFCNGLMFKSPEEIFDVVPGFELATARHFVSRTPPVERTLRLVYWAREGHETAFLRADDNPPSNRWRTIALGDIVRVKRPSIEPNPASPGSFFVYRQVNRDTLSRVEVVSNEEGIRVAEVKRAVESASSPMIDSLREAIEKRTAK